MRYGHSTMTGRWGQYHVVGESRYHVHGDHYAWKVVPHVHTITTGEEIRCDQALLVKRQSFPTPSRMVKKSGHALLQTPRSGRSWARIGSFKTLLRQRLGSAPPGAPSATRRQRAERQPLQSAPEQGGERRSAALLVLDTRRRTGERRAGPGGRPRERRFEECWGENFKAGLQFSGVAPSRGTPPFHASQAHLHSTHLAPATTRDGGAVGLAAHR